MENSRVKLYFEDLTINAEYRLLEWGVDGGKDNDELMELAIKKGIQVPSHDLAFFKCKYAMVDKANRNKCTLPRKEVKKALKTLNGKAIDKDHLRKSTIGHWLQAELEDSDIIAYGCFWKSNFPEDYKIIKSKMDEGAVKVSFEAWGEKVYKDKGNYELINIEFAGGALLFDTEPAFPDAEVLNFASERENRVLEFAKVIEENQLPDDEIKPNMNMNVAEGDNNMEIAKFNFIPNDCMIIDKFLWETPCPSCEAKGMYNVSLIDFENSIAKANCFKCGAKYSLHLEPDVTMEKKGKKIQKMTKSSEEIIKENNKGGNTVMEEILKKYNKATIEEVVAFLEGDLETIKTSLSTKEQEMATITKSLEDVKLEIEKARLDIEKAQLEAKDAKEKLDAKLAEEKASIVTARKTELGEEFAKDMSDEDILNDLKFELAKTKKELAALKQEKGTVKNEGLEAGTKIITSPTFEKQEKIRKQAYPENK